MLFGVTYPNRNSIVRFDVGTTLVRYLRDHPDPKMSPINDLRSTHYIVTQGDFQISTYIAGRPPDCHLRRKCFHSPATHMHLRDARKKPFTQWIPSVKSPSHS